MDVPKLPVITETDKKTKKRIYFCPSCGEQVFVSSSKYRCVYCKESLLWPENEFRHVKRK